MYANFDVALFSIFYFTDLEHGDQCTVSLICNDTLHLECSQSSSTCQCKNTHYTDNNVCFESELYLSCYNKHLSPSCEGDMKIFIPRQL